MIEIRSLGNLDLVDIVDCFNLAFADYMVNMPTSVSYYRDRWKAALVDYTLSFGAFDGNRLIGFIINGIDTRFGYKIAFNTGTGVLPPYRGQRIVQKIYDKTTPELKIHGINKLSLEVITTNNIAIKAYERVGFNICKIYKCYRGKLIPNPSSSLKISPLDINDINWSIFPNQSFYSWDHNPASMLKGGYAPYIIKNNEGVNISFFFLNKKKKSLAQFDVFSELDDNWTSLWHAVAQRCPDIKLNNIDARLAEKIEAIDKANLENYIDQYEMECFI